MKKVYCLLSLIVLVISPFISLPLLKAHGNAIKAKGSRRPNIILILSDDMGYSDIGCYGSEINTPNLDMLANDGLRYTNFYNVSRCCPSRACLMTGLYPHQTGIGWMTAAHHSESGYTGELNQNCVTIAEVLKQAGYATYMTGKWHLCLKKDATTPDQTFEKKYDWPLQRGFDKFYGILLGAANYYDPGTLCRDNNLINPYIDSAYHPEHYYFTDAISDNSVKFIQERDADKPFFMYVAYTTAHWPMQAPEKEIEKYKGKYNEGYEAVREARLKRMKALGIIDGDEQLSPPDEGVRKWPEEKNKPAMERRMETYAAMIDVMDQGIGRIINELKNEGIYDNTVIIYLQDNGACHETMGGGATRTVVRDTNNVKRLTKESIIYTINPPVTRDGKMVMQGNRVMAGPEDTYVAYLRGWANVSNTPFRMYKHWVYEGGISTPLIVHWPDGIKEKGGIRKQVGHEIDIMPTIAELAQAKYPEKYKEHAIKPEAGVSLVPTFDNKPLERRALYWEHEMNKAVRQDNWKLVCRSKMMDGGDGNWKHYQCGPWELYNMDSDRSELHDLSGSNPELVAKMAAMWNTWAHAHDVFPAPWKEEDE